MENIFKKIFISSLLILLVLFSSKAQTLSEIMSNPDLNFYQIQTQINSNNKSAFNSATEKEQKRYDRWLTFWDTRVNKNGGFITYGDAVYNYSQIL